MFYNIGSRPASYGGATATTAAASTTGSKVFPLTKFVSPTFGSQYACLTCLTCLGSPPQIGLFLFVLRYPRLPRLGGQLDSRRYKNV